MENQKAFLDSIGKKIGVRDSDLSPWYKVDMALLRKLGVGGLVSSTYGSSLYGMLCSVYPDHNWVAWRFRKLPLRIGRDDLVIKEVLQFLEKERKITKPEDWYQVSIQVLKTFGVNSIISQMGGLYKVLKRYRPDLGGLSEEKFVGVTHFGAISLGKSLRKLFPDLEILENHALSPSGQSPVSFFFPAIKLAVDYQDISSYSDIKPNSDGFVSLRMDKDKLGMALENGITLVFCPFWWDRTPASLAATLIELNSSISEHMNPIFSEFPSDPIPLQSKVEVTRWKRRNS